MNVEVVACKPGEIKSHTIALCDQFNEHYGKQQNLLIKIFQCAMNDVAGEEWKILEKNCDGRYFSNAKKQIWKRIKNSVKNKGTYNTYCSTVKKVIWFDLDWNICKISDWDILEEACIRAKEDKKPGTYHEKMIAIIKSLKGEKEDKDEEYESEDISHYFPKTKNCDAKEWRKKMLTTIAACFQHPLIIPLISGESNEAKDLQTILKIARKYKDK